MVEVSPLLPATQTTLALQELQSPHPNLSPVLQLSAPATPDSSPEKLDWGSIDDEDGTYAAKASGLDTAALASASPAQRAASPDLQQDAQVTFKLPLSPLHTLKPAAPPTKVVTKLKSVLVIPEHLNEAEQPDCLNAGVSQQGSDPSWKWQVVK
jgi:hypothetical protein